MFFIMSVNPSLDVERINYIHETMLGCVGVNKEAGNSAGPRS